MGGREEEREGYEAQEVVGRHDLSVPVIGCWRGWQVMATCDLLKQKESTAYGSYIEPHGQHAGPISK